MSVPAQQISVDTLGRSRTVLMIRSFLFFATGGVCAANGLASLVIKSIQTKGFFAAASSTFDVSALVWISVLIGLRFLSTTENGARARATDLSICGSCLALSTIPVGYASWLALTLMCVAVLISPASEGPTKKGARILLAVTIPVFWARLMLSFCAPTLLGIDAKMTAAILGTHVTGNLVEFSNHSGYFQIYPACSSFGNISLALLGLWTALTSVGRNSVSRSIALGAGLSFSVFAVNIVRLTAIGIFPEHFELIHGDVGSAVAGGMAILLVAIFCFVGCRTTWR